jgi:hypothetical protein
METNEFSEKNRIKDNVKIFKVLFSPTIGLFYLSILVVIGIVLLFVKSFKIVV